jgi:hypothetical protein
VAGALLAQERATARIEARVWDLLSTELPGIRVLPHPEDLLRELLAVPEPQRLMVEFLAEYAGGPGSEEAFGALGAGMADLATAQVFADLVGHVPGELEKLLLLAVDGDIAKVALAGTAFPARDVGARGEMGGVAGPSNPGTSRLAAPRMVDLRVDAAAEAARALDWSTRRQVRLVTALHGQAEAIARLRMWRAERTAAPPGSPSDPREPQKPEVPPGEPKEGASAADRAVRGQGLVARSKAWARAGILVLLRPLVRAEIRFADLAVLEIALDAIGEVVDAAAEQLAQGEACRAVYLLAGLQVPVPAGLPGRLFQQESLAQVRPLAAVGIQHRLAVARWAASVLAAMERGDLGPARARNGEEGSGPVTAKASGEHR